MHAAATPPETFRPAFAPALIAAAALLAGISLLGSEWYLTVRFIVAILAVIVGWFSVQARQWWWTVVMLAIAVLWNPAYPLAFEGTWWVAAHIVAAGTLVTAGALIRVPRATTA